MNNIEFEIFNNYEEPVCIFSADREIVFKNKIFDSLFSNVKSLKRFKNRFNFDICPLTTENLINITPIEMLLNSGENFHTICSYQNSKDEYIFLYIYSYNLLLDSSINSLYKKEESYNNTECRKNKLEQYKVVIFKNISIQNELNSVKFEYENLKEKYNKVNESNKKFLKLQENSQREVLKMGIINKISLIIRETNDIDTILDSALYEIHNLLGSFKTYFSVPEKKNFKIKYSLNDKSQIGTISAYEEDVINTINNKNISVAACLKEYLNCEIIFPKGVKRIIIPVYNKKKLLGIIVTLTKQRFNPDDNKEILQSISVQLASSIIQAELIRQLNNKNKKLEKALKELKETQLQLINSEKMASLGQLVSGVAHEINTPLASISSNNAMIQKILSSTNIDTVKHNILKELNNIDIEAAVRISNIVKSLKKFVRLDEAEFQKADINKEIDLTLKLIVHETKDKINIIRNYSDLPPIYCSVNMLNQVFMNLLINACHAIKEFKVNGEIEITTLIENNKLVVKIKDDGAGISKKNQSKIFNVGFTTKKIGTGFGLAISRKIVELHKGSITFTSKEGKGSEFTVCIPLIKEISHI